jgi:3-oxoacyl-[acyl-carrier-protein] synthase-3
MKFTISKISYSLPSSSENLEDLKLANPDWDISKIYKKTGINSRWIAEENQTASDLALIAANKMFEIIPNKKKEIDLLIFVSQTPDYFLPTTACVLQSRIGLDKKVMAFDINLGCSGFVYGLSVISAFFENGAINKALLICADTYTKFISKNDRTNRPIFSDGAAVILLEKTNTKFIAPFVFGTDGSRSESLIVRNGAMRGFTKQKSSDIRLEMDGGGVFLFTISEIPKAVKQLLDKAKFGLEDIDLIIFHQANKFVIDNLIEKLSLNPKKVFTNYEKIGNTVSASIPIALKDAEDSGLLDNGDKIMLVGFGVGLSWGATIIEWNYHK